MIESMDEFPIAVVPSIAHWSENFALAGFDPSCGVDLFLHLGRWRKDTSLWRELVAFALPDGTVAAHRAIGNARESQIGPGGPCFGLQVTIPGRRLEYHYLGSARRVPSNELTMGHLADGPNERLEFSLLFDSDRQIWDLGRVGHKTEWMGRGHIEQLGRVQGEIKIGSDRFSFDSIINRDHSRGPRVAATISRHSWMHGTFTNGVSFLAYEGDAPSMDSVAYAEASVYDGGRLYDATLKLGYRLSNEQIPEDLSVEIPFQLEYDKGKLDIRVIGFPTTMNCQFTGPWDTYLGRRRIGSQKNRYYVEQSLMLQLADGTQGYGHMERTVPGILIDEPN